MSLFSFLWIVLLNLTVVKWLRLERQGRLGQLQRVGALEERQSLQVQRAETAL